MPKTAPTSASNKTKPRVMVFIDNSNVYQSLKALNKIDKQWIKAYDPHILSERLTGKDRELVKIFFYCAPPPEYMKKDSVDSKRAYWMQTSYYNAIKRNIKLELKYAYLTGIKGDMHEKNLDSQLIVDMLTEATKDSFDTAILIGCDGDYQSVVKAVKNLGKKLELVYFRDNKTMSLVMWCDVSRRARLSLFEQLHFPYSEGST